MIFLNGHVLLFKKVTSGPPIALFYNIVCLRVQCLYTLKREERKKMNGIKKEKDLLKRHLRFREINVRTLLIVVLYNVEYGISVTK